MYIVPLTLQKSNDFVEKHHRHHKRVIGYRFALGLKVGDELIGILIAGRPVSRGFDPNTTLEINRLCTTGEYNACSKLYSAAARIAKEMGFKFIVTYILEDEPGTSLKASGWTFDGLTAGGAWKHYKGPRANDHPLCKKQRWIKVLNA